MQRSDAESHMPAPSERPGETTLGGRYRLVRQLGVGGMGVVYEAENLRTGRHVAVKVLDAARSGDTAQVARFLQEARSAARIVHPNVVDVIDLDRDGDALFIVQELLLGEDLSSHLEAHGSLSAAQTLAVAIPALRGLAHAHARGVVHRDIKPSNVFLAREGDGAVVPKIIDFGISKMIGEGGPALVLTSTGEIFGTPAYMSPEQLRGSRDVDARADVWAFGVLLYECLSGTLPVDSDNYNVLVHEVLSGRRRRLHEVAPAIPAALAEVVMKALAMDPADRYPDAGALLDALTPLAAPAQSPIAPPPPPLAAPGPSAASTAPTEPAASGAVSRPRWLMPLAVVAVSMVALALSLRARRPEPRTSPGSIAAAPALLPPTAVPAVAPAAEVHDAGTPAMAPPPSLAASPTPLGDAPRAGRRQRRHRSAAAIEAPTTPGATPATPPSSRATLLAPGGAYPGP